MSVTVKSKLAYGAMLLSSSDGAASSNSNLNEAEKQHAKSTWKVTSYVTGVSRVLLNVLCFILALSLPKTVWMLVSRELPIYGASYFRGELLIGVMGVLAGSFTLLMTWEPLFESAFEQAYVHNAFAYHIPMAVVNDGFYVVFFAMLVGVHDIFVLITLFLLPIVGNFVLYAFDLIQDKFLTNRFKDALGQGSLEAADRVGHKDHVNWILFVGAAIALLGGQLMPFAYSIQFMMNQTAAGTGVTGHQWFYISLFCVAAFVEIARLALYVVRYSDAMEENSWTAKLRRLRYWEPTIIGLINLRGLATELMFYFAFFL
jgi:hypothetical protein